MYVTHRVRIHIEVCFLLGCCLLLCTACSGQNQQNVLSSTPTKSTTQAIPTAVPMPATQTSCPQNPRAAIKRQMARGSDPIVVYSDNTDTSAKLLAYNVKTKETKKVLESTDTYFSEAQVSHDGQWILFISSVTGSGDPGYAIQMVRMDGQGLQTLDCFTLGIADILLRGMQWSPDDTHVIFSEGSAGFNGGTQSYSLFLMNLTNGVVEQELTNPDSAIGFLASTWLDNTHVFITNRDKVSRTEELFLLDTAKGQKQQVSDLKKVVDLSIDGAGWSFDTSIDNKSIFTSRIGVVNSAGVPLGGPSVINVQDVASGQSQFILSKDNWIITQTRTLTTTVLTFIVDNGDGSQSKQNGLWTMHTDGTSVRHIATGTHISLNRNTQYTWSNFSRDSSLYAVDMKGSQQQMLSFRVMSGGDTTTFASADYGSGNTRGIYERLAVAGWTTL